MCRRKFGKQIQKRQLEVPEYAASFVNYKALKKVIIHLSIYPLLLYHTATHTLSPSLIFPPSLKCPHFAFSLVLLEKTGGDGG